MCYPPPLFFGEGEERSGAFAGTEINSNRVRCCKVSMGPRRQLCTEGENWPKVDVIWANLGTGHFLPRAAVQGEQNIAADHFWVDVQDAW